MFNPGFARNNCHRHPGRQRYNVLIFECSTPSSKLMRHAREIFPKGCFDVRIKHSSKTASQSISRRVPFKRPGNAPQTTALSSVVAVLFSLVWVRQGSSSFAQVGRLPASVFLQPDGIHVHMLFLDAAYSVLPGIRNSTSSPSHLHRSGCCLNVQ